MARISKEPLVRMNEILDAAENLFYSKGYDETAVSDIVNEIGVAQGTFYNYFASKESVLDAVVNRHLSKTYREMEDIVNSDRSVPNKLELVIYSTFNNLRNGDGWMFDFLYNHKHLHIVDKFIRQASAMFAPLMKKIFEEGNQLGYFKISHPDEVLDFFSAVLTCICHSLYQNHSGEPLEWRLEIAARMIESALGLEKGALHLTV